MLILGIVLIVLALLIPALKALFVIGALIALVGLALAVAGWSGHSVGGRKYWY